MKSVQKAGAIILSQKDPALIALLYRSKQNDWSFPKGHVEKDESPIETACREIKEETGLSVIQIVDLPPIEYRHPTESHIINHMFLMRSENDSSLKNEFRNDKISWIPYKEIAEKLSYSNTKEYYTSILNFIEKQIANLQSKNN